MNDLPVIIAEIANSHGGNVQDIYAMIDGLSAWSYDKRAIKFQPFRYDQIALPDFEWYQVYEKLFIEPGEWSEIIAQSIDKVGQVWLDIFDSYGVEILQQNRTRISGIKLQASVLDNIEVLTALKEQGLANVKLMLNISGYELQDIERFIARFEPLQPAELILQIGYQSYPTEIEDTALNKIGVLQEAFPGAPLCFADHASAEESFAHRIPVIASAMGCVYIEKHACHNRENAEYDHYSALELDELQEVSDDIAKLGKAFSKEFISLSEVDYLETSNQVPVLKHSLSAGALVSRDDVVFRRTVQKGLTLAELDRLQSEREILDGPIQAGCVLQKTDFRPARIAVIVACRMKSSRLKQKAVLPIQGMASVERCLENCLLIPHAESVVLATSTIDEDAVLKDYTLGERVKFWRGDPDDVIMRYIGACDEYGVDVVIRVTADCPVVSPEIAAILLESHFKTGSDYTAANKYAVGSNSEIYNVSALKHVIELIGKADYSEYMTWYMTNNPDVFKVNIIDLPEDLVRDYRLTLDYPEDLELLESLYVELKKRNLPSDIASVFKVLDSDPELPALNNHLTLRYETDTALIDKLNEVTRITSCKKA